MTHRGKVVLITGASSGIGKVTAQLLVQSGFTVYTAARRLAQMEDLKALGAIPLQMDVTQEADLQAALLTIQKEHGGVDILINNAGFGAYGAVEDFDLQDARYQFEVNLFGLARLTQLVLPHMREKKAGTIVNISSMGGKMYTPLGAWYHATKHALEGWSDCLRLELKPFNIQVVIIEPGAIETEFGDVMMEPMLKRSGQGPYQKMAQAVAKATANEYHKPGSASPPSLIAKTILRAVTSKRPKTRYATGKWARPMIFIRKYLGDRIFDWIIMSQVR